MEFSSVVFMLTKHRRSSRFSQTEHMEFAIDIRVGAFIACRINTGEILFEILLTSCGVHNLVGRGWYLILCCVDLCKFIEVVPNYILIWWEMNSVQINDRVEYVRYARIFTSLFSDGIWDFYCGIVQARFGVLILWRSRKYIISGQWCTNGGLEMVGISKHVIYSRVNIYDCFLVFFFFEFWNNNNSCVPNYILFGPHLETCFPLLYLT